MHYMLIQDGLPQVLDATHYATDAAPSCPNLGYVDAYRAPIKFDQQTVDVLANGRLGAFHADQCGWQPGLGRARRRRCALLPDARRLERRPVDPTTGLNDCPQAQSTTLVNDKDEASLREPFTYSTDLDERELRIGDARDVRTNGRSAKATKVRSSDFRRRTTSPPSDQLSSALWNGTLNSNMVFLEAYELVLWQARQEKLGGNSVLSTYGRGLCRRPARQKSLAAWSTELHKRRRSSPATRATRRIRT